MIVLIKNCFLNETFFRSRRCRWESLHNLQQRARFWVIAISDSGCGQGIIQTNFECTLRIDTQGSCRSVIFVPILRDAQKCFITLVSALALCVNFLWENSIHSIKTIACQPVNENAEFFVLTFMCKLQVRSPALSQSANKIINRKNFSTLAKQLNTRTKPVWHLAEIFFSRRELKMLFAWIPRRLGNGFW